MKELQQLLKKFFGYSEFRPLQAEIIQHILQKKNLIIIEKMQIFYEME